MAVLKRRQVLCAALTFGLAVFRTYSKAQEYEAFDSYSQALDRLLSTSQCPGLVAFRDFEEIFPDEPGLSDDLIQRCELFNNGSTGATLGGSLNTPFSTLTFLPFTTSTITPTEETRDAQEKSLFALGEFGKGQLDGRFDFLGGSLQVAAFVAYTRDSDTAVALGQNSAERQVHAVWTTNLGSRSRFGVGVFRLHEEASANATPVTTLNFADIEAGIDNGNIVVRTSEEVELEIARLNAACARLGVGTRDVDTRGGYLFGSVHLGSATRLDVQARYMDEESRYTTPHCTARIGLDFNGDRTYHGVIAGNPERDGLSFSAQLAHTVRLDHVVLTPRVRLTKERFREDAYDEREIRFTNLPTGVALRYEARETNALYLELGTTLVWPLSSGAAAWIDAAWIKTLDAPDNTMRVSFAGDNRDEPVRFTFPTNPTDTSVFQLSAGYDVFAGAVATASVFGSVLLGHSYRDSYSVGAALRWEF